MTTKIELKGTLSYNLSQISRLLVLDLNHRFLAKKIDITVDQWSVLNSLWSNDGLCQNQLASCTGKDRSSITRIIDGMAKQDLLYRVSSEADRRNNLIFLTAKGKELKSLLSKIVSGFESDISELFTHDELANLRMMINRIDIFLHQKNSLNNNPKKTTK